MPYPAYKDSVVDCTVPVDTSKVKGKCIVITGGANGMGEQSVRTFIQAGAYVTFGDVNEAAGRKLESELGRNATFVPCDVTSWDSQLEMFKVAKRSTDHHAIDVVIANAGITGTDPVFYGQDQNEPMKPDLKIMDVNCTGAIYTMTLARHYFLKNEPGRDRCFIIFSSLAGYVDVPGGPLYMASKFAARAFMRCLRRTTVVDGIRACAIAPWYVRTGLMSPAVIEYVAGRGVDFAEAADAAGALLKIAADDSINGRCLTVVPHEETVAPYGYYDMNIDDYPKGSRAYEQQMGQLKYSHRLRVDAENQG